MIAERLLDIGMWLTNNQHQIGISSMAIRSKYTEMKAIRIAYTVHDTSQRSSLTVVFKVLKSDLNYMCSGGQQGFIVALHPPNEGPQTYKRYFHVPLQQTVLLAVKPKYKVISKSVGTHDLNARRCYLNDERQLRFYKQYTAHNCRMECLSNSTLAQCECVKFSQPRTLWFECSNVLLCLRPIDLFFGFCFSFSFRNR